MEEIDRLLDHYTDAEIAVRLNEQGLDSGEGHPFTRLRVRNVRLAYQLKSRYDRLREAGMLTLNEMAKELGICRDTVQCWRR